MWQDGALLIQDWTPTGKAQSILATWRRPRNALLPVGRSRVTLALWEMARVIRGKPKHILGSSLFRIPSLKINSQRHKVQFRLEPLYSGGEDLSLTLCTVSVIQKDSGKALLDLLQWRIQWLISSCKNSTTRKVYILPPPPQPENLLF